eukprot:COSAG01_NODE_4408_length_5059_cov_2.693565_3_plen_67_part_00
MGAPTPAVAASPRPAPVAAAAAADPQEALQLGADTAATPSRVGTTGRDARQPGDDANPSAKKRLCS